MLEDTTNTIEYYNTTNTPQMDEGSERVDDTDERIGGYADGWLGAYERMSGSDRPPRVAYRKPVGNTCRMPQSGSEEG